MRTFKIVVVTILLLLGATAALAGIKGWVSEPGLDESYREDNHEETEDDIYSKQLKQFEGTVKILGISIYQEGTHRLEKDDKLLLILESSKVNLDEFEGQEVKVRGFVRDTVEGGQKIMDVASIEPLTESGVKLFNEVGYEFSFSYPAEWEVKKEADKVTFSQKKNEANETVMVVYQYEDVKESLEVWLKNRDQNLFYEEAQVKVGESTGVRRTVKNGDQQIIKTYVKEGNNAYEIRLVAQDEVVRNQYFSIVDFFKTNFTAEEILPEASEDETATSDEEATPTEEDKETTTEEPASEEKIPEEEVKTEEPTSSESFSTLEPLTSDQVKKVIEKGFANFQGRTLSFVYPKMWYFSYLGDGKYGITDEVTFKANNEEITEGISRILMGSGTFSSCSEKLTKTLGQTTYTVCAREPGLSEIIKRIADSLAQPE